MGADLVVNGVMLPDVRLAVFDKDGTIIDVHTYWANMVRFRAEFIGEKLGLNQETRTGLMESMGVQTNQMRIKPEGPVGLKKREVVLKSGVDYLVSKGYQDYTEAFQTAFKEVDNYSLNKFDHIIKALPGVKELFSGLKALGCQIALATTDIKERAARAMEHLRLLHFIDEITGADSVRRPKPDPEIIFFICKKLGVEAGRTVMIGDVQSDIKTGLNAGCLACIGVESGLTSRDKLLDLTPLVIPDIRKITLRSRIQ